MKIATCEVQEKTVQSSGAPTQVNIDTLVRIKSAEGEFLQHCIEQTYLTGTQNTICSKTIANGENTEWQLKNLTACGLRR